VALESVPQPLPDEETVGPVPAAAAEQGKPPAPAPAATSDTLPH